MRLKIGAHEVEGTVEEVAKLLGLLSGEVASDGPESKASSLGGPSPFISEGLAYDALTRRPLGIISAKMLRTLDKAGDGWTAAPELQKTLGLSTREFAGLLGAFGKRISHTDGEGSRTFFDQYWDQENGYNLYRLPPSVRSALRKAKVV